LLKSLYFSLVSTPTLKPFLKIPCDSKKTNFHCWMERETTVRMQDFIPFDKVRVCVCIKESAIVVMTDIETFVITEGNRAQTALYTVRCSVHCDCGLCVDLL